MRHVIQHRVKKTDEIRIGRTLSAFDLLDITYGDMKRQIIEMMWVSFLSSS